MTQEKYLSGSTRTFVEFPKENFDLKPNEKKIKSFIYAHVPSHTFDPKFINLCVFVLHARRSVTLTLEHIIPHLTSEKQPPKSFATMNATLAFDLRDDRAALSKSENRDMLTQIFPSTTGVAINGFFLYIYVTEMPPSRGQRRSLVSHYIWPPDLLPSIDPCPLEGLFTEETVPSLIRWTDAT
ncbi:hypothetical protein QQX98_011790 [Neonectria punicea]|uniref:HNH nuclease domain-containing protein n=1 Tax=Neonectria punicea TaxID=979145 RepID=A0ABR1GKQ8_9HYPO